MRLIFLSFERNILPVLILIFAFCLVIFSKTNLIATKNDGNVVKGSLIE